jgi:tRNA dimethylallyltransferase
MQNKKYLIVIAGPTAIGKSQLAIDLAHEFSCEILSADSRQFYREISIGTAKPTEEEMQCIPHHFINNLSINEYFSVGDFEKEALKVIEKLHQKNDVAIMVGGSGLYINGVVYGFDELPPSDEKTRTFLEEQFQLHGIEWLQNKLHELDEVTFHKIDKGNHHRMMRAIEVSMVTGEPYSLLLQKKAKPRPFETIFIVLNTEREKLYNKINSRVDLMMKNGLLEEVKGLTEHQQNNALNTVGYKELFDYLKGSCTLDFAIDKIKQNSRNYAKRQITWFKKNEEARWFEPTQKEEIVKFIKESLA